MVGMHIASEVVYVLTCVFHSLTPLHKHMQCTCKCIHKRYLIGCCQGQHSPGHPLQGRRTSTPFCVVVAVVVVVVVAVGVAVLLICFKIIFFIC